MPFRARFRRFLTLPIAALAAVAVVTACSSSNESSPTTTTPATGVPASTPPAAQGEAAATVEVKGMAFTPATVTIKAGQTVTWKFDDNNIPHTVSGLRDSGMGIDSPILRDGTYSHTFDKAGTYDYICSIHPQMKGVVIVEQ